MNYYFWLGHEAEPPTYRAWVDSLTREQAAREVKRQGIDE